MEINKEISILEILKESLKSLKNKEILIATMTFVLIGTAISIPNNPFYEFTIKKLILYIPGQFILLIGEMIIIKIMDKKYKKEEVNLKNIINELIPRSLSAFGLYLLVTTIIMVGGAALIIPGIIFMVYAAFYLQVFTLENCGIEATIENCVSFSKGFRVFVFKLLIILTIIGLINDEGLVRLLDHFFNSSISTVVNIILGTLIFSFTTIGITDLYLKIKEIKTIE
ncbi:MAG: hypothetical protein ACM3X7_07435 [Solirubrobacterales bacterium]